VYAQTGGLSLCLSKEQQLRQKSRPSLSHYSLGRENSHAIQVATSILFAQSAHVINCKDKQLAKEIRFVQRSPNPPRTHHKSIIDRALFEGVA